MKIFATTIQGPSTFFRLEQYIPLLEAAGITFVPHPKEADLVFVQKRLFSLGEQKALRKVAKRLLFDFDDAIWTRPHKPYRFPTSWRVKNRLHFWLKEADIVTCASSFLGDYASPLCRPHVIPLAVDTNLWKPRQERPSGPIRLGWAGAPHNLHHIEKLAPVLEQLPDFSLHIFSGKRPSLQIPFTYHPFSEEGQAAFIQNLDIGLLPLSREEYSLGKSPIKAIQYIACGLPVVGNVYGATQDILKENFSFAVESESDWLIAIKKLASDPHLRQAMGGQARAFALAHHSRNTVAKKLINLLTG